MRSAHVPRAHTLPWAAVDARRLERSLPWVFGVLAFALRMTYAAAFPTEWDSAQLAMGVERFDLTEHTPHPPGFWLYVALGRVVRATTPLDAHASLVLLGAAASGLLVAVSYLIGRAVAGPLLGAGVAAFVVTSPYAWFYGSIAATYSFEALVGAVLLLLAIRAREHSGHGIAAAAVLGAGAGFRPTALVVFAPLAAAAILRSVRRPADAVAAVSAAAGTMLLWAVPMWLEQPGGLEAWWTATGQWGEAVRGSAAAAGGERSLVERNIASAAAHTLAALGPLLPVAVLGLVGVWRRRPDGPWRLEPLLAVAAVLGPLAFNLFFFFGKGGHVVPYLVPAALLALYPATRADRSTLVVVGLVLCAVVGFNAQRFVAAGGIVADGTAHGEIVPHANGAPFPLTAETIRTADGQAHAAAALERAFDPRRDVLVVPLGRSPVRWRHLTWALPEFRVHLVPRDGLDETTAQGFRWMHDCDAEIEVPPGGRAVVVVDDPGMVVGAATALPDGAAVALPPGATALGLTVVEEVSAADPVAAHAGAVEADRVARACPDA